MLHQVFRVLLLYATGGKTYYESLLSNGLKWANEVINSISEPILSVCGNGNTGA